MSETEAREYIEEYNSYLDSLHYKHPRLEEFS